MIRELNIDEIRTYPCPDCYVCGTRGKNLYADLKDRLFGAPGEWNFKKCPNPECGLVWLDPMPVEESMSLAYRNYYTHQDTERFPNTLPRRTYGLVQEGYLAHKYGYCNGSMATWKKLLGMLMYLHPGRREDVDFNIMYLPANPKGHLLELGCGSGQILKRTQQMGWQVEGVDLLGAPDGISSSNGFAVCKRGILCRKDDALAFTKGLEYLVDLDARNKRRLLTKARSYVKERFSEERLIRDYRIFVS